MYGSATRFLSTAAIYVGSPTHFWLSELTDIPNLAFLRDQASKGQRDCAQRFGKLRSQEDEGPIPLDSVTAFWLLLLDGCREGC